jgi:hypothetical protein
LGRGTLLQRFRQTSSSLASLLSKPSGIGFVLMVFYVLLARVKLML